jgi:hypothetical protein
LFYSRVVALPHHHAARERGPAGRGKEEGKKEGRQETKVVFSHRKKYKSQREQGQCTMSDKPTEQPPKETIFEAKPAEVSSTTDEVADSGGSFDKTWVFAFDDAPKTTSHTFCFNTDRALLIFRTLCATSWLMRVS